MKVLLARLGVRLENAHPTVGAFRRMTPRGTLSRRSRNCHRTPKRTPSWGTRWPLRAIECLLAAADAFMRAAAETAGRDFRSARLRAARRDCPRARPTRRL